MWPVFPSENTAKDLEDVIQAKLQADKDEGYTEGARIRQVKNIVHKFNHFLDTDNNKLNRAERNNFDKLGSIIGHHKLNFRVNVIHYLYNTMPDIERMGYTLFYKIDDITPENNDFIYCMEYGELRGAKVAEPFKFAKSEYNKLKDHKQIYNLIESEKKAGQFPQPNPHAGTSSQFRPLTPAEIRANILNATIKEDSPNHKKTYDASGVCEHKITAGNGLTFICDDFGRQLIAEIMGGINDANRDRARAVAV